MKRIFAISLSALLLFSGCAASTPQAQEPAATYDSRFSSETLIELSEGGIKTDSESVYESRDIIYYEDRDTYESGNPYGEGEGADRHSAQEAAAHRVVNITAPGAYRVRGKLSAGQIRVDLGEDAYEDETAVVELILDGADITCTVAPAILFLNVYECDGDWSEDTAGARVDTAEAGANLILLGENTVNGSYVARIYKDQEGEKKLWKQDGAIYSYMSMNVSGPGALELTAENEGLDSELHLSIHSGDITILAGNDGINTNEDNVSVTTINGGNIRIIAGLGEEGDGIDSNGYLVINGGNVVAAANPAADAGLDSDCGSYIHGGTVVALGAAMDWAESDSGQVTMNLQFAAHREGSDAITVTGEDGKEIFAFDPAAALGEYARRYGGAILSCPELKQGDTYCVYAGGVQQCYTGTDVLRGPGGFGGQRPGGQNREELPTDMEPVPPENFEGQPPEDFDGQPPEDFNGQLPEDFDRQPPEDFDGQLPEGPGRREGAGFEGEPPEGFEDFGSRSPGNFGGGNRNQRQGASTGGSTAFYMNDMVNFFSGISDVSA